MAADSEMDGGRRQICSRERDLRRELSYDAYERVEVSSLTCFRVGSNQIESPTFCFERQILFRIEGFRIFSSFGLLFLLFFLRFTLWAIQK